jgi:hypothetical protein
MVPRARTPFYNTPALGCVIIIKQHTPPVKQSARNYHPLGLCALCVFGADFCLAPAELRLLVLYGSLTLGYTGGGRRRHHFRRRCSSVFQLWSAELRIGIYNLGEAPEEKYKSREEAATSDWQEIALSGSHFIAHRRSHSHETTDKYSVP